MAYENYTQVSWTPATPITADRLQQMSENTQQVKDATDDVPRGLIKIKEISNSITQSSMDTYHEIINLKNEGAGNPNNTVTLPASRYARITLNFPGIKISTPGQEDSVFELKLTQGNISAAPTTLYTWFISQPIHTFLNASVATPTTGTITTTHQIRSNSAPSYFGAGTYSHVIATGGGISGSAGTGIFNIQIQRNSGNSAANPSTFVIPCSESKMQMYLEDIGGQG
jgi:hypothetical protein